MAARDQARVDRKLYDAVKKENVSEITRFLERGANPDAPVGKNRMTSMHRAAMSKNADIQRLLHAKGGTLQTAPSTNMRLVSHPAGARANTTRGTPESTTTSDVPPLQRANTAPSG